jgi:hypothetical protein
VNAAQETQLAHAANGDGWCAFHLRHYGLHIPAGTCAPFLLATEVLRARRKTQATRMRVTYSRRPPQPRGPSHQKASP